MQLPEWLNQEALTTLLTTWGLKVIAAIAVLVIGWIVVKLLSRGIAKAMTRSNRMDATVATFITKIIYAVLLVIVVLAAISQLGVQMTAAFAVLGAAGLALALSLQGSLSNFASGILLISARPMKHGEFVECAGIMGVVDHVGIFYTQLHTVDNQVITVANSLIFDQPIINYSAQDKRRFNEIIRIGYDDDLKAAKDVLERVLADEPRLLADPPPQILVLGLQESNVDLGVRCWIATDIFWDVRSDLLTRIKDELETAGIRIPYPQQTVHYRERSGDSQAA